MKKTAIMLLLISLTAFTPQTKTRILFFGDSITQMGVEPGGYIDRIQTILNTGNNAGNYELIGAGVSANKIYDMYLRMDEDVIAKHPDVVVLYEGVNDVWHKTLLGTGTDLDKYEKFYAAVIKKLQAEKIKVVLVTPACIGEKKHNANPQDAELNKYCDVIRKLADTTKCTLLDLRKLTQEYESTHNTRNKEKGLLTTDKVHLTDTGNQLLADELVKVLDH